MLYRFTLSHESGTSVLTSNPKGWDGIELIAKRDITYIGMFFDFTIKLDFFCNGGGKEFIDDVYDNYGIDANITILIEEDCDESGMYEEVYTGTLDLETYQRTYTQPEYTTVAVVQAGPLQVIKSRLDTKIDLTKLETIDGTALTAFTYGPYDLHLHSKAIILSSKFSCPGGSNTPVNVNVSDSTAGLNFPMNLTIEYDELPSVYDYVNFPSVGAISDSIPDSMFIAGESGTYTISYDIQGVFSDSYDQARTYNLSLAYRVNGGATAIYDWGSLGHPAGEATYALNSSGTLTLNLSANDTFCIYLAVSGYSSITDPTDPLYTLVLNDGSYVKFSKETITADSTCKAIAIHEAFARVCQSITNSTDAFRSNFFGRLNSEPNAYTANGCGSFTAITNGFQIRQFPIVDQFNTDGDLLQAGKPPFTSLRELFDSCNAIYNLGLGIEQSGTDYFIRVEPKEYFFSQDVLLQIPNIKGLKKTIANDFYFNQFIGGFEVWQQDGTQGVNGLDEVNTKREYVLGVKKFDKKLEVLSKLIGGAYPLEVTRRKSFSSFPTTNYQYDDKNFIICLNRDVNGLGEPENLITAEKDENYPGTTNILSPSTTYNERITPGRIVRNWLKWLTPSIIKNNSVLKAIKFSFGEGNYKMTSQGTDACDCMDFIDEGADLEVLVPNANTNYNPLFVPEIIEFNAPLSLADYKLIKANPTRCIEVSTNDVDYDRAFIMQVKYRPSKGEASFVMLLAENADNYCSHIYVEDGYVECGYVS